MPYPDNFDEAAFDRRWGHARKDEREYSDLAEQQDDGKRHELAEQEMHPMLKDVLDGIQAFNKLKSEGVI